MLETLGTSLGVVLAILAVLGLLWRFVLLPNLREQLFQPIEDTRRQVVENRHKHTRPTILDRIDDVEQTLEAIALNQQAILKRLGDHIGESTTDRSHLWLMVESLIYDRRTGRKQRHDKRGDQGGA